MPQPRVLATGGAAFIGSHVADAFLSAGYHVTVLDSLTRGRRENLPGGVAIFCDNLASGRPHAIFGDGEQTRDCVYVADVARANVLLAAGETFHARHPDGRAFNVATGVGTSVVTLAGLIAMAGGEEYRAGHRPPRPGEVRYSRLDAARVRALGWEPETDLETGLLRTLTDLGADSAAPVAAE